MNAGWIGGIVGSVIGVAGGLIGTWASIRNTSGPRERAFAVKASIIGWSVGGVFFVLLLLLPFPWRFFLWIPYGFLLPWGIITWNKTLQKIQREELQGQNRDSDSKEAE